MRLGHRRTSAQKAEQIPLETERTLKLAMESMDALIREAKANRDKVKQVVKDLEAFTRQR
jgi:hypothetical protein